MTIHSPPTRPMLGGTNEGKRPQRFTYWRTGYGDPPTTPLAFHIAQAGEYHCKPGYRTSHAEHPHQTHFYYHIAGSATLESDSYRGPVELGSLLIVPARQKYVYFGQHDIKHHWFGIEGQWPPALGTPAVQLLTVGGDADLEAMFVEIREILILRRPGYALRAIGVFYQLLARLEELFNTAQPESAYPETVRNAITYLRENYAEPFVSSKVADSVGLSPSHLRALFEKWVGESPKRFHTRCRIDQARRLLGDQNLSVLEAGFHVGFDDVHHFSRVFKQITGVPPSQYADQRQQQALLPDAAD